MSRGHIPFIVHIPALLSRELFELFIPLLCPQNHLIMSPFIAIGLFLADQNLNGKVTSIHTRQNPNGNRRGYECPEERDYYPYWHPTDWIDIAVLADDPLFCSYYRNESFNIKPKG